MLGVIDISALFKTIVTNVDEAIAANYRFNVYSYEGRYLEVTRDLIEKDIGITTNKVAKKYPLIWFVTGYTIVEGIASIGVEIKKLEIIIAYPTKENSTTRDRKEESFVPILYPVYAELKKQIDVSGFFNDIDFNNNWEWIDQPYWDGKEKNGANLFNDYIDAIQLKNIHLTVNEQTCERFQLITGT